MISIDSFIGVQYPLVKTPRGTFAQKKGIDQIKADLLQLLLTNPGERCMMPTYGTPLRTLVFDPNDISLEIEAKQMILQSIREWEPRIVIKNIYVTSRPDADSVGQVETETDIGHILSISIEFIDPNNLAQTEKLSLQLPIGD